MKIRIKQVDAFTTVPQTGNPAGVVLDGKELSEIQMRSIAREMNVSETAFLVPPTKPGVAARIRWFTPTDEVTLCGHATVAAFHVLAEEGRMGMSKPGGYHFNLETLSGILPVDVTKEDRSITVMLGLRIPSFERVMQYKVDLVRALNVNRSDFNPDLPICRNDNIYVPMRRLHTLFTLKPNLTILADFLSTRNLHGICVYTTETIERESAVHSRFFAPNIGINEDPVTGSAHGPLGVLLFQNGMLEATDGRYLFQGEQGDAIGRKGRVSVELIVEDGKPCSVRIGGNAVTVLEGEMVVHG
jgi:trans-2,3-dihydro-3-hydroxyanthranilate isomerase